MPASVPSRESSRPYAPAWLLIPAVLLALVALPTGCAGIGKHLVMKSDERTDRNADGICPKAVPRTLGPEDADTAILFIHGYLGAGSNFGNVPDRLADEGWRVRVMRVPGHGTSPIDLAQTTTEAMLDAIHTEIGALRAHHKTVVLAGESMGGALSTVTASREKVDGLVLLAPYFGVKHRWYYILPPETWAKVLSPVLPWVYKGSLGQPLNDKTLRNHAFSYAWVPASSVKRLMALGRTVNTDEVIQSVTCPVLLIQSKNDSVANPGASEAALDRMTNAAAKRAVWLEKSDHLICLDYERDQVLAEIRDFVRGL